MPGPAATALSRGRGFCHRPLGVFQNTRQKPEVNGATLQANQQYPGWYSWAFESQAGEPTMFDRCHERSQSFSVYTSRCMKLDRPQIDLIRRVDARDIDKLRREGSVIDWGSVGVCSGSGSGEPLRLWRLELPGRDCQSGADSQLVVIVIRTVR
jgi:hypothetical protein